MDWSVAIFWEIDINLLKIDIPNNTFSNIKLLQELDLISFPTVLLSKKEQSIEISEISSGEYTLKLNSKLLTKGNYSLKCIIYTPGSAQHDVIDECCSFDIIDGPPNFSHLEGFDYGVVYSEGEWFKTK